MANETAGTPVDVGATTAPAEVEPGRNALDTEYGNPYDPNTPPYSVYIDPKGEQMRREEAATAKAEKAKGGAKGTEYRFDGHEQETEGTQRIYLSGGYTVDRGESAPISDEEVEKLKALGFKLTKSSK